MGFAVVTACGSNRTYFETALSQPTAAWVAVNFAKSYATLESLRGIVGSRYTSIQAKIRAGESICPPTPDCGRADLTARKQAPAGESLSPQLSLTGCVVYIPRLELYGSGKARKAWRSSLMMP